MMIMMKNKYILGIACGYHDSAACLLKDGKVLGAVEEERFTGIKHDSSFPTNAINWLYNEFKITGAYVSVVSFYENPTTKLERIEETTKRGGVLQYFKRNAILKENKQKYKETERKIYEITNDKIILSYGDHHLSHIAYSYYTSPFDRSAIISVDGVGEWETTVLAFAENNKITKIQNIKFPHSLGMIYSAFTAFLGFKPNEGEYKVMGLAPYGNPNVYTKHFKELIKETEDGGFEINMDYFTYDYSNNSMFNEKLGLLLGIPNRLPEDKIEQHHKDLAATIQSQYEYFFFRLINKMFAIHPSNNICLSGGCAYNGTANGKITKESPYKQLWIPPAPSDAGSAIGCALEYYYTHTENVSRVDNTNPYLGPWYSNDEIKEELDKQSNDVWYEYKNHSELIPIISKEITDGNVIGWYEGRMEFGSRALGNRSILANPRDPQMKSRVNRVIKKREGFRPFAPIVKEEERLKYFDYKLLVPYMNQVVKVNSEHIDNLPAITHVDGSARIQTLNNRQHKRMYSLLNQLERDNGYPIVLNTSFNLKDKTIVNSPKDAIETFLDCEMDTLVLGNYIVKKKIK
jgi:carbamoyltransferase